MQFGGRVNHRMPPDLKYARPGMRGHPYDSIDSNSSGDGNDGDTGDDG
jgi:hypothetical protein